MTLSNTPLVTRLQERYCNHAWRLRDSSRLIWLWLRACACRRRGARRAWLRPGWRPPALARRWRGELEGARWGGTPARGATCKGVLFFLYPPSPPLHLPCPPPSQGEGSVCQAYMV